MSTIPSTLQISVPFIRDPAPSFELISSVHLVDAVDIISDASLIQRNANPFVPRIVDLHFLFFLPLSRLEFPSRRISIAIRKNFLPILLVDSVIGHSDENGRRAPIIFLLSRRARCRGRTRFRWKANRFSRAGGNVIRYSRSNCSG